MLQKLLTEFADVKPILRDVKPPTIPPGVVPEGREAPVLAADSLAYTFCNDAFPGSGFPGFAYLSQLATRAEYRAFADAISKEMTREWIEFTCAGTDGTGAEKIKAIEAEFSRLDIRGVFNRAAQHDCYFGRAQIYIKLRGADPKTPLILDSRTVPVGSFEGINTVEAIWTTPSQYNANDATSPSFYKPTNWFMIGVEVHASRLMTIVTRELPDMLKPAYNFAGMSLSQLAEPYVNNWLRTRQSVSDLISNFSITAIATAMDQILQGEDDGASVIRRAQLFTATRNNLGVMLLDKEREELVQVNTPLSGLSELQAQSQEHMCSVSRLPAIILTGISPAGLNASSDGEIRVFYDWIASQQTSYWLHPLQTILKVVQLSLFGEIDETISIKFKPLYQMSPKEAAEIREIDARTDATYLDRNVISADETRTKLADDPDSGYQGLETEMVEVDPNVENDPIDLSQ